MKTKYTIKAKAIRQIPEPNVLSTNGYNTRRWTLLVNVSDLPQGVSDKPNPRQPKVNRKLWREIKAELLNDGDAPENIFHLKNKGITISVESFQRNRKREECSIVLDDQHLHGILDGGHTYTIISESQDSILERNEQGDNIQQFVKMEVLENYPDELISEIARGLNTGIQVKEKSLANLDNKFDKIKDAIKGQVYENNVAYNENGNEKIDIETILAHLYMFNTRDFSASSRVVPIRAYSAKAGYRDHYLKNLDLYDSLAEHTPIFLEMSDYISSTARDAWNNAKAGRKGGRLSIIKNGKTDFYFLDTQGNYSLERSALYPILSAFRVFLNYDEKTNKFTWTKTLKEMKKIWDTNGSQMLEIAKSTTYGTSPHMRGRNKDLWDRCTVEMLLIR